MHKYNKIIILLVIILNITAVSAFSAKLKEASITSDPSGAAFIITGESAEYTTPASHNFRIGREYTITFMKNGYKNKTVNFTGGTGNIHVKLQKKNSNNGGSKLISARITSDPSGVNYEISGESRTYKTPDTHNFRKKREYTLTFFKKGYKTKKITYIGGEGNIHVKLKKNDSDSKVKVKIESSPEGASFYINDNDNDKYKTPEILKFKKGKKYKLTFNKKGYHKKEITYIGGEGNIYVKLKKKAEKVKAYITSDPSGAKFYISDDDDEIYKTPATLEFKKGKEYVIIFNKKDYKRKKVTFVGGEGDLHVRLKRKNVTLIIESNVDDANVFIDDEMVGKTPLRLEMEPGTYEIKVNKKGFRRYKKTVEVTGDMEIYAKLKKQNIISINLPNGSQIYINGEKRKINWKDHDDKWKVFAFSAENEVNEIKVKYHGMVIKRTVKFDGKQIQLMLDLE